MRILFLTPQLPYPLHQGTALRNFGLIQGLARRHQVSLLSFLEPRQSLEAAGPLLALCQRVETVPAPTPRSLARRALDTIAHRLPDMGLRLASPAFASRLAAWLAEASFDVVHVEGLEMTPFLDLALTAATRADMTSSLILFDDHNCEYMLQKRYAQIDARIPRRWPGALYSFVQWQKLRVYEAGVCRRAHRVLAVSQTDALALQRLVPGLEVAVIPNGIDTDQYSLSHPHHPPLGQTNQPTVVFVGKMDFRPNVDAALWFADAIWPQVRTQVSQAHLYIVGQRPHPQLDRLRGDPTITLTGWVEDVRSYIAGASVYVAPLRMGSGTRLKLLEAMALGKAIISTQLGAEGLVDPFDVQRSVAGDEKLVLVADDAPDAFTDAVVALLRDPARRTCLGRAARTFVETNYDWRVIIPRLEALYAQWVR